VPVKQTKQTSINHIQVARVLRLAVPSTIRSSKNTAWKGINYSNLFRAITY